MDELKLRLYQEKILNTCKDKNTLVVLPTGTGKTYLALALAQLKINSGKIFFLAPTKPLVTQHKELFMNYFNEDSLTVITGAIPPKKRQEYYKTKKIIFETPQTLENDIITRRTSLEDTSLIVFDEAHRAIGDYAYCFIAKQYFKQTEKPHIIALSASPGSDIEKIKEVMDNLYLEKIEAISSDDPLIKDEIKEKNTIPVFVDFPLELMETKTILQNIASENLEALFDLSFSNTKDLSKIRKASLLALQNKIMSRIHKGSGSILFNALVHVTIIIKIMHCIELLESHGPKSLISYYEKLIEQGKTTKSARRLTEDMRFKKALALAESANERGVEHPKYNILKKIITAEFNKSSNSKIIVFTQYREVTRIIESKIKDIDICRPVVFVGQKEGVTQKKQLEIMDNFKSGKYNVLICTSVAEEGIHVKDCDVGVFFEPIPSALRTIQRKGRVGRTLVGKIYVLITKNSVDEKYYWVSKAKEKRMQYAIKNIKEKEQKNLKTFQMNF